MSVVGFQKSLAAVKNVPKQARFALSNAINATAKDVQKMELEKTLPGAFTLRSKGQPWQKPGGKFGVNIRPFSNRNTLTATIGSQADWLKLQERGGQKSASGHSLAINVKARPSPTAVIPRELKPRRLLVDKGDFLRKGRGGKDILSRKSGKGFIIRTQGFSGIFFRNSPKELILLYVLKDSAKIKPILKFESSGVALAALVFPGHFDREFKKAISTAT